MDQSTPPIQENPFSEDLMKGFSSKDIVKDLRCGICLEITVQAQECVQCAELFCKQCIQDCYKNSKSVRCPTCNISEWKLKEPHKIYKNLLSRLQFKCTSPNCTEPYSIDNFKYHEHKYIGENQINYYYALMSGQDIVTDIDQTLAKEFEQKWIDKVRNFTHYIGNQKHIFDFSNPKNLKAVNLQNNLTYTIQRKQLEFPITLKKYKWVWFCNDSSEWKQYNPQQSDELDRLYALFIKNPEANTPYTMKINGFDYKFDFQKLHQINQKTNYRRSIFRCPVINKMRFVQS